MKRKAFIVIGMAYGDEGKGSVVDWLVREHGAKLVVRFNGGAQAAHHVVDPDGRQHTFSQFGSGTLAGARTHLSEHVLVNPLKLATEAEELMFLGIERPFDLMTIDPRAAVTTPYHVALNRMRELSRGDERHGSCGLGIAETMVDVLRGRAMRYGDIGKRGWVAQLETIRMRAIAVATRIAKPNPIYADLLAPWQAEWDVLRDPRQLDPVIDAFSTVARHVKARGLPQLPEASVFEGAQGILLDETWGFAPYNTWSTTTSENARALLRGIDVDTTVLGVIRAYLTRHGRGPLPTEDKQKLMREESNPTNPWQEHLRFGWPDLVTMRYAAQVDPFLDGLVVTCLDHVRAPMPIGIYKTRDLSGCTAEERTAVLESARPEYCDYSASVLPQVLAGWTGIPLWGLSYGPTAAGKRRADQPRRTRVDADFLHAFGVKDDGITDDTVAIQNAINAAAVLRPK